MNENKCGADAYYEITDYGRTIYISGQGALFSLNEWNRYWDGLPTPWDEDYERNTLIIQEGITIIGEALFKETKIDHVYLPASLLVIERDAFAYSLVTNYHFSDGLKEIGSYAFFANNNVKEIQLPRSVSRVRSCAFCLCERLESINLPGVRYVEANAFSNTSVRELQLGPELDYFALSSIESTNLERIVFNSLSAPVFRGLLDALPESVEIQVPAHAVGYEPLGWRRRLVYT